MQSEGHLLLKYLQAAQRPEIMVQDHPQRFFQCFASVEQNLKRFWRWICQDQRIKESIYLYGKKPCGHD